MRFLLLMVVATIAAAGPDTPSMHQAAEAGDLNALAKLLAQDGALDMLYTPNRDGGTPLHVAAFGGHARFVEHALQFVSRTAGDQETTKLVRTESFKRSTALHKAARGESVETAKLLLDAGALPDAKNSRNLTPILLAATAGASDVASLLLLHGADPLQRDVNGLSIGELAERHDHKQFREKTWPLHADAARGDGAKVSAHLKAGVKVNAVDDRGDTAIRAAANWGHADIVSTLEKAGAKPDVFVIVAMDRPAELPKLISANPSLIGLRDGYGFTPLHWAVRHGRAGMIPLLATPETLSALTNERRTPLDLAVEFRFPDIVSALTATGAKLNQTERLGRTRLHEATRRGDAATVAFLCSVGADVNAQDYAGKTPLHYAVEDERKELAEQLIEAGANVNAKAHSGDTPLHASVQRSAILTQFLLDNGADPNAQDNHEATPLFRLVSAPKAEQLAICRALLDGRARAEEVNKSGESLLDLLFKQDPPSGGGFPDVEALLIKHGAEYRNWHGPREVFGWSIRKATAATGNSVMDDVAYYLFVHWLNESVRGRDSRPNGRFEPESDSTYRLWRAFRQERIHRIGRFKPIKSESGKVLARVRKRVLKNYGRERQLAVYQFLREQQERCGSMMPDLLAQTGWDGPDAVQAWHRDYAQISIGINDRDEVAYIMFVYFLRLYYENQGFMDYAERVPIENEHTVKLWHKFRDFASGNPGTLKTGELASKYGANNTRQFVLKRYDTRTRNRIRRHLERYPSD